MTVIAPPAFAKAVYPQIPPAERGYLGRQVNALQACRDWEARQPIMLRFVGDQVPGWSDPIPIEDLGEIVRTPVRRARAMLTAALERLAEPEISSLGQAAWYAVSLHRQWRDAAAAFLRTLQPLEIEAWQAGHKGYAGFVLAIRAAQTSRHEAAA